jgi:hypothetical protein
LTGRGVSWLGAVHRGIDHAVLIGSERMVVAELRPESECGQCTTQCFGFCLFEIVTEVAERLRAPSGRGAPAYPAFERNINGGLKIAFLSSCEINSVSMHGVRVIRAKPEQSPLHFEIIRAGNFGEIFRGVEFVIAHR